MTESKSKSILMEFEQAARSAKGEPQRELQSALFELIKTFNTYSQRAKQTTDTAQKLRPSDRLNEAIRVARIEQKLSQKELANLSSISLGTIVALEKGKRTTALETVERVLRALGMSLWIK